MEYLQYSTEYIEPRTRKDLGFKPYYKWNTFNTQPDGSVKKVSVCFKPYYKWNTFNTIFR